MKPKSKRILITIITVVIAALLLIVIFYINGRQTQRDEQIPMHSTNGSAIILIGGEEGKYGTTLSVGGKEYIAYHVPPGEYYIANITGTPIQVVFYRDGTKTSESGIEERILSETKPIFLSEEQSLPVEIKKNEYLTIPEGAIVEMVDSTENQSPEAGN